MCHRSLPTAAGRIRATLLLVGLAGCGAADHIAAPPTPLPPNEIPLTVLGLATPDGSGQTVHPDHVTVPPHWHGYASYLALTPYPNGDATYENPSLYGGDDGTRWSAPDGVRNPIVRPAAGYLSDPDAVFVPDRNELWIYYRAVTDHNVILVTRSGDGVHFGAPVVVAEGPNHTIVSPAVVRRSASEWLMWSVNANVGCTARSTSVELHRSTNGLDWSPPATVALTQPGYAVWHIDVQWIASRGEYWALYNVKTAGSCTTPAVYLATSADGLTWHTYPSPVLAHGAIPEFADIVYRSTFAYDPASDAIAFWYSGARYEVPNYVWRSAYQRRARADVFAAIAAPIEAARVRASAVGRAAPPPLLDAP